MSTVTTHPGENERTLAGLAHAGILLGLITSGLGGPIVALIIWLTQRDESEWVRFQALQALAYQLLGIAVVFVSMMCWFGLWFASLVPLMANPEQYTDAPPPAMFASLALLCLPLGLTVLWTLYGVWGGLRAWQGADFRYVILGDLLSRRTDGDDA
jgi:uncharacterized Tic20 family protein